MDAQGIERAEIMGDWYEDVNYQLDEEREYEEREERHHQEEQEELHGEEPFLVIFIL